MPPRLSPDLQRTIEVLFPAERWSAVAELLLAKCGETLPLIPSQGQVGITRVRCAVLKLSGGSWNALQEAVRGARSDWRDVLVAAGFADSLTAHRAWLKSHEV
jgi:hypothetical protein